MSDDEEQRKAAYWTRKKARKDRQKAKKKFAQRDRDDVAAAMFSTHGLPQIMLAQALTLGKRKKKRT